MKLARVGLVAALLVPITGDGRASLPTFSSGVCTVPSAQLYPGLYAAARFWFHGTGEGRAALTVPADVRLTAAFVRVQARARKYGYQFDAPKLRQTRPELVLVLGPGIRYVFAMHYSGPRIILTNSWWTDKMDDAEVEMLLAHELGHAIDVQNERRGHRILDLFTEKDDHDLVADFIAMLLFEPGQYLAFQEKFPLGQER